ncbi:MAG: TlpA family protein disulfide reductase [Prevotellaceae bacterium]|nr:TlpA family protein disulfide reductase [Prevotellaceae bacterium]
MNTTRKLAATACALTLCAVAGAQDFSLKVSTLAGGGVDRCILMVMNESRTEPLRRDTLSIVDGKAELSLELGEVREGVVSFLKGEASTMGMYLLLVPSEALTLTETNEGWEYGGSQFYEEAGAVKSRLNTLETALRQRIAALSGAKDVEEADEDSLERLEQETYEAFRKDYVATILDCARENPDAEGMAMWLPYAQDETMSVVGLLSDRVRNESRVAPVIQRTVDEAQAREQRRKEMEAAKEKVGEGKPAPEFTLKDINGNDLSLSSLRGKYVALDFWGSWCPWCIKGFPRMKEYYAKYAGRFEIVGVDCRDTQEKWTKAVADYELPWLHVYNPDDSDLPTRYAIEGYPTKIVIDPDGNIAKVVVGESEDFYDYLDQLFGN